MLYWKTRRAVAGRDLLTLLAALLVFAGVSLPAHSQTFSVIHNFTGSDGGDPFAGPVLDHGNLYGTTNSGGVHGSGAVYKLSQHGSSWILNPLYSFAGAADGAGPGFGTLAIGSDGTFFGTTEGGGLFGVAYNLKPRPNPCGSILCPWNDNVIWIFGRGTDGAQPLSGMTFDSAGNLFGTTSVGGTTGNGTVFELTRSGQTWTETTLYNFAGGTDAVSPVAGVSIDASGNLYGSSPFGGANGAGAVFKLTKSGSGYTESVIYNFTGGNDGQAPTGGVIVDAAGNLYGGTFFGGVNGGGTIYKLAPSGGGYTLTTLYSFSGFGGPYNWFTMANGTMYGITNGDGAFSKGSVWKLTPNGGGWTFTNLYDFTGGNDGGVPYGQVAVDASGNVYGTASIGGSANQGVVWKVAP
jgi:uncharacterized repeat protein (TIGR03803 family)